MTENISCKKNYIKIAQFFLQIAMVAHLWMLSEGIADEDIHIEDIQPYESEWKSDEQSRAMPLTSDENIEGSAGNNKSDSQDDESMETINQPFIWQKDATYCRLWGNLRNIIQTNDLNDRSLFNPGDKLNAPTLNNLAQAKIKIDANVGKHVGLFMHERVQYEIRKTSEDCEEDVNDHLDQAYGSLEFGNNILTFLSIGKQRIKWGNGRLWTPVDTINPKQDLSDFEQTDEGRVSYRLDVAHKDVSATVVAMPNADSTTFKLDNFRSKNGTRLMAGKIDLFVFDSDISFYISDMEKKDIRYGVSFATELSDIQFYGEAIFWDGRSERPYIRLVSERQTLFDPVGDTQYVLPAEYTVEQRDGSYYKVLFGIQYTFSSDLNLILEYYHQDDGYDKDDMDNYIEFLNYIGGQYEDDVDSTIVAENRNPMLAFPDFPSQQSLLQEGSGLYEMARLRKNYLHISTHWLYLFSNRFDLGFDAIINLDDLFEGDGGSYFLRPIITYTGFQNWTLSLYGQLYLGLDENEFGMAPYDGTAFFEVKYFF